MGGITLYDVARTLAELNDELMESGGDISDELEKKLDDSELAFREKIEGITKWRLNLIGQEAAIEAEIFRLEAKRKSVGNLHARLEKYIKLCMERSEKTKLDFNTFTITLAKNPPSLEIKNASVIPAKYIEVRTEHVLKRREILDDLKKGETVPGAELITNRTHLKIR